MRALACFVLIDPITNATVAAGMIRSVIAESVQMLVAPTLLLDGREHAVPTMDVLRRVLTEQGS